MSNREIIDKINRLADIYETLRRRVIHVQNEYGILAYATSNSVSNEFWWLEDGRCVEVFKTNLNLVARETSRLPQFDIEV